MKRRCVPGATALVLLAMGPLASAEARAAPDPWPGSPALIRLYLLPAGRADRERLARELALRPGQIAELRQLAEIEAAYGQAGRQVIGRAEAARLNAELAAMRVQKDRRVRAALEEKYPAFREWLRRWWAGQVEAARREVR